mgnify:FL=1
MTRSNSADLKIFRSIASKLEDFSSQVLEDSSAINSGGGTDTVLGRDSCLQKPVDSTNRELARRL